MNREQRIRLRRLWEQYREDPSDRQLHALALEYLDFIRETAVRLARSLPQCVEIDDLTQVGFLGLRRAIKSYDEGRQTQFTTFAGLHVKGAMLDSIRADDPASRTFRRHAAALAKASRELAQALGRLPTEGEVAEFLGISPRAVERHGAAARAIAVLPLSGVQRGGELAGGGREALPADRHAEDPAESAAREDLKEYFTRGFEPHERLVLILYYYENMTMREIGETLDISESRVSQLHSLLIKRLKSRFVHAGV